MFLLALLSFYRSTFAEGTDGPFYNCSTIRNSEECINTFWCIWSNLGNGDCYYDTCLLWRSDTDMDCTGAETSTIKCQLRYLKDGIDCDTGGPSMVNRFCRVDVTRQENFERKSLSGQTCFYEDLKSIGSAGGARSCGNKICSWKTIKDVGRYCDFGGGEDCSSYITPEDICPCLGKEYCDLYPQCIVDGNNCKPDPCINATVSTGAVAGGTCDRGLVPASDCVARLKYESGDGDDPEQKLFCTTKSSATTQNECFGAVKVIDHDSPWSSDEKGECKYQTYDDSICTKAKTLDENATVPIPSDKACQLVDIPPGYFKRSKYCTDGDRKIPSTTGAASSIHVSLYTFLLLMIAAVFTL